MNGINEVIGITQGEWLNTAPLGVIVEDENSTSARIKLYRSHTRDNIERGANLWVNVVYDPFVFVISSFEDLQKNYFESMDPPLIRNSLAWAKMETSVEGSFVHLHLVDGEVMERNFRIRAVNRGFNSLIEALVHATRYAKSQDEGLKNRILYYGKIIEKCGRREEKEAFKLLLDYVGLSSIL
ncbi:MAG: DUF447 domain-containing protein [Halobacteriota archaeon]